MFGRLGSGKELPDQTNSLAFVGSAVGIACRPEDQNISTIGICFFDTSR
jgi:hypothetical protein